MSRFERSAGIVLHPTSFPGGSGIGDIGSKNYWVFDWMKEAGMTLWQILPLGPTGFGDSPYQCFSAFAGNPLLIDFVPFLDSGQLERSQLEILKDQSEHKVNYGVVVTEKFKILRHMFDHIDNLRINQTYKSFCENEKTWLDDYALFMALKDHHHGAPWYEWETGYRDRDEGYLEKFKEINSKNIQFYKWVQFQFFSQWADLREKVNSLGIKIIGDIPIFVALDSADAWANRELFHFDEDANPTVIAGVPPDYFSETGQKWGNPLYNWKVHQKDDYSWWKSRMAKMLDLVDIIRIDHFRGFYNYWEIPYGEETAVNGSWKMGPGANFFKSVFKTFNNLPVIAEDLGEYEKGVDDLRQQFNLPGMKILQFAWSGGYDNRNLPHNHEKNSVVYPGTHDNNTTVGWWFESSTDEEKDNIRKYWNQEVDSIHDRFIRMTLSSVANTALITMQDTLGLGGDCKMNMPGSPDGNWSWRLDGSMLTAGHANWLRSLNKMYNRIKDERIKEEDS